MFIPRQTVYITRYALTKGIIEAAATNQLGKLYLCKNVCVESNGIHNLFEDDECFFDKEDAIKDAKNRVEQAVEKLEHELSRLKQLTFED